MSLKYLNFEFTIWRKCYMGYIGSSLCEELAKPVS